MKNMNQDHRVLEDQLNRARVQLANSEQQNRKLRDELSNNKTVKFDTTRVKSLENALRELLRAVEDATRDEAVPLRLSNAVETARRVLGETA